MARGGYRPGAGRRPNATLREDKIIPEDITRAAARSGMTPLEYMLRVMRNPEADQARRDRMAVAAAPFCHSRVADNRISKKDAQEAAAKTAGDEDWDGDLTFDGGRPN